MRLGDLDALLGKVEEYWDTAHIQSVTRRTGKTLWRGIHAGVNYCRNLVLEAPTIEAEPVKHGRWVYGEDVDIQCSVCGSDALTEGDYRQVRSDYCPNCGAKMDLEG